MGASAEQSKIIAALLWLPVLGCANGSPRLEWTARNAELQFQGDAAQFAVRDKSSWRGEFDTNVFALVVAPLPDVGYFIDLTNRTRFPIEFDWTRSLLVDHIGWTHPILYPGEAYGASVMPERGSPILVAPYAKRRIAVWSPSFLESPLRIPFKPRTSESSAFRPKPSKEGETIEESIFIVLRYQEWELRYRMRIELVAARAKVESGSSANEVSEPVSPGD